jgi:hypothetical protein
MEHKIINASEMFESLPSMTFVHAISQLLETDSIDILIELGYVEPGDCCRIPVPNKHREATWRLIGATNDPMLGDNYLG